MERSVVILGGGTSSYYISKNLRNMGYTAPIFIVSEERYLPYNRVLLPRLLKQEIDVEKVFFADSSWYAENNVSVLLDTEISVQDEQVLLNQCSVSHSTMYSGEDYVQSFYPQLLETIQNELEKNNPIVIVSTGGDAYQPDVFPSSDLVRTWRTFDDTLKLTKTLSESKSVALVGGSFIGMELAMACDHFGVSTDWGIISKGFIRDALDQSITEKLMEGFNSQVVNTCFESSFSDIEEVNGSLTAKLNGTQKEYDLLLLGTGIRPSLPVSKQPIKQSGWYYAGDMVTFEFEGKTVNTGSFNQSIKVSKIIAQDIMEEINIEDNSDIFQDIALTPYQIRFGGKPIRLAGLVDTSFKTEIETTDTKITQTWYNDSGEKVGYCIV